MHLAQSLKGWKLLLVVGLLITLSVSLWKTKFLTRTKMSWLTRLFALRSPYSKLWRYMVAQAKFETNDFKSEAYINEHNMFGMGNAPEGRGQPGKPSIRKYDNPPRSIRSYWWDIASMRDQLRYFAQVKFPTEISGTSQYAAELKKRGYYQSDEIAYKKGLDRWL
jgi:hypothetical protein